jgi:dinuclear metal center YbgI/SA1388 family protein
MGTPLKAILSIIEGFIPPALAEPWDNVGLQIGDPNWPVKSVRVALDPSAEVVQAACKDGVDLLVTHHPLIFKPVKKIDLSTPQGSLVGAAISHRMAIYAAHTNFDRMADGLNDILSRKIGLRQLHPLERVVASEGLAIGDGHGMGRIGKLEHAVALIELAQQLKSLLNLDHIKVAGRTDLTVETVALCTGSGSSLLDLFINSGAEVYISGDLRYHDARTAEACDLALSDIGHFSSEHLMVEALAQRLAGVLAEKKINVAVSACKIEKDPFLLV